MQLIRVTNHPTILHSGLGLFLRAIERLNASALVNSAPVQRVDRKLQTAFDAVGLSTPLVRLSRRAHAMAAKASTDRVNAPQSSGPQSSGPQSSGPQFSGPQFSGPQSNAEQSAPASTTTVQNEPTRSAPAQPIVTQAPSPVQPFSFANQAGRFAASRFVASQSSSSVFQKPTIPPATESPAFPQTPLGGRILRDEAERQVLVAAPQLPAVSHPTASIAERHAISTVSRLGFVLAGLLLLISVSALGLRATSDATPVDQAQTQAEAERGHSLAVVNPANASGAMPGDAAAAPNSANAAAPLAVLAQPPAGANAVAPAANSAVAADISNPAAEPPVADEAAAASNVDNDASSDADSAVLTLPQADAAQPAQTQPEPEADQPQAGQGLGILSFLNIRSAAPAADMADPADSGQAVEAVAESATQSPVGQALAILAPSPTPTRTPYPTFTAMPSATPTATATEFYPEEVPLLRIVGPSLLKPTDTPTPPPTATFTPTPTPLPISPGKLWSTFQPGPAAEVDHLWIERPFLPGTPNQLESPNYQFGLHGRRSLPHPPRCRYFERTGDAGNCRRSGRSDSRWAG
ncbi:MAG: hypothetical protein R2911_34980 [Caldilineaceae bacterium]